MKEDFLNALKELRQINKKRKFDQTIDLIVNLKDFNLKQDILNVLVLLPHATKKKRICAFFENPSIIPDYTIAKKEIERLNAEDIKTFARNYDLFIAAAKLMPIIASKFGKTLGPLGKMPDPKIGAVLPDENDETVSRVIKKLSGSVKVRAKEASVKIALGKESMPDEQIAENAFAVYEKFLEALPKKKENIKSVMLKFTMSKPVKINWKKKEGEKK